MHSTKDLIGTWITAGTYVAIPTQVTRNDGELRLGKVVAVHEDGDASVITTDNRVVLVSPNGMVYVPTEDLPERVERDLSAAARLVK